MPEVEVEADEAKVYAQQMNEFTVRLDCFKASFGYKGRSEIQLRLEPEDRIYLCDDRESRSFGEPRMISGDVPFQLFANEWPRFVQCLLAKDGEEEQDG